MVKASNKEDRHLEALCAEHFPDSSERRWPLAQGAGWFKAPRALPVLLQILGGKESKKGNPGRAYLELLSRVREPGLIVLDHPDEHARLIGYSRARTWLEAMQKLQEAGFIETKQSHERAFAYALIINPFIAVKRLHQQEKLEDKLWHLFHEKWTKAGAEIPEESDTEKSS